jgi:hypothetical protein
MAVMKGSALLLSGANAIETPVGVEIALPVVPVATFDKLAHEPEVVKASFEAYKARLAGKPVMKMPPLAIRGRRQGPPRADWLTGVQYRLNALGFGAGPIDGVKGPKTTGAILAFQKTYPPLRVDGIPGSQTQARLVALCGY